MDKVYKCIDTYDSLHNVISLIVPYNKYNLLKYLFVLSYIFTNNFFFTVAAIRALLLLLRLFYWKQKYGIFMLDVQKILLVHKSKALEVVSLMILHTKGYLPWIGVTSIIMCKIISKQKAWYLLARNRRITRNINSCVNQQIDIINKIIDIKD